VGHFHLGRDEFFQHSETVQSGHLHIQKHQVRRVFFDQRNGFHAVLALANHVDFREALQQERELVARGLLVVYNNGVYGHVL
jgi:hypothetical protein